MIHIISVPKHKGYVTVSFIQDGVEKIRRAYQDQNDEYFLPKRKENGSRATHTILTIRGAPALHPVKRN